MVQIQQHDDFTDDPHHHHHHASTSTTVTTTTTSPPHHHRHRHDDSPSSASSISSDHTFHAFSPPKSHLPSPSPPPPQQQQQQPSLLPVVSAGRLIRQQPPETVTKTETDAETGFASAAVSGRKPPRPRAAVGSRGKGVKWVEGFLRFIEFAACLVSFAVMASDKRRGWALDSFDRYVEFRYAMTVNVIGFAYSGLQGLDLLRQLIMGKDLMQSRLRYCFDFAMDQILAYLLLSSSSSAYTRVDDWISNWGKDKFPAMASASVGVSILSFIAFASSSLVSGYTLSTHQHSL